MSTYYESIKQGLEEALAFARGEDTGAKVHQVAVAEVDVAAIRASDAEGLFAESQHEQTQM